MNCSSCGKKIAKSSKFCPNCGVKIEDKKVIEQPSEEVEEQISEAYSNTQENIKEENTINNVQNVEIVKNPTGAFVASIIVTVLSLLSLNFIALTFGIIAIVYLCIYKEEVSNELKQRKISNGKVFNIISWVVYGIGMIVRLVCVVCIIIPIIYLTESYDLNDERELDYSENYYYEEEIYYDEEDEYYNSYSYDYITEINYDQFMTLYNGNTESVVVLVQTYCGYCNMYKPILDAIAYNKNIDIYYLDILNLTDTEYNYLLNNIDFFQENAYWGTPTTLIVKNSSTIDYLEGYVDENTTLDFYRKNSIIR